MALRKTSRTKTAKAEAEAAEIKAADAEVAETWAAKVEAAKAKVSGVSEVEAAEAAEAMATEEEVSKAEAAEVADAEQDAKTAHLKMNQATGVHVAAMKAKESEYVAEAVDLDMAGMPEKLVYLGQAVIDTDEAAKAAKVKVNQARKDFVSTRKATADDEDSILARERANQAIAEAEKDHDKAIKAVNLAKANFAKETERQREVKASKKKDAKFLASLKSQAKEISDGLDKAAVTEGKADDLRLHTAGVMVNVEEKFAQNKPKGVKFKDWCVSSNICVEGVKGRSWENLRKLLAVGKSSDPAVALEDLRAANAVANKRARVNAKEEKSESKGEESSSRQSGNVTVSLSHTQVVQSIVDALVSERNLDVLLEISSIVAAAIEDYEVVPDAIPVSDDVEVKKYDNGVEEYDSLEDKADIDQFLADRGV